MRTRTWPLSSTSSSDRASVYDLERRELVLIEDLGENRNEGSHEAVVGRPHINGGLLAYIQGSGDPGSVPYDRHMTDETPPDSIAANIAEWSETNAEWTDAQAERAWAPKDLTWGVFNVREDAIGSPLGDVDGVDVVELGCGTAYFSAQLARRGARPVGVDPTLAQLDTARRMMERTGITFPLVDAPGERVPLPDASFDLAVSEFGASLWADPALWVPEAARLMRPGGRLVFLTNSFVSYLCDVDEGGTSETLQRPQFGPISMQWPGEQGIEYHLAHGDWIDLLRGAGFEIERLIELRAPPDAKAHEFYDYVTPEWASKWPHEEIWVACKRNR